MGSEVVRSLFGALGAAAFSLSALAHRAALEETELRAALLCERRGIDPSAWLADARQRARARASTEVTTTYLDALVAEVDTLARERGAP